VRVLNMAGVGAPQQVMLEVKVAEVSKAVMDRSASISPAPTRPATGR